MNEAWRAANARALELARRIYARQSAGEQIPKDDPELVEYTAAAKARQAEIDKEQGR